MSCVGGTMDTKGLTGVLGDKWGDSMNKEEAKKEALALVVQERIECLNKLRECSVDDEKEKIKDASLISWKPKMYETYYTINFEHMNYNVSIITVKWTDSSVDYLRLLQGMVYRTYEEADHNQWNDYKKLTGLRLTDVKLSPYI